MMHHCSECNSTPCSLALQAFSQLAQAAEDAKVILSITDYVSESYELELALLEVAPFLIQPSACPHQWEWVGGGGDPASPTEPEKVCKLCGIVKGTE